MDSFLTLFFFFLIIGFLIFIHELGHFLAAKITGVGVQEFAIGFGPTLLSREFRGTLYQIKLLPFGGFVQLVGESSPNIPGGFRTRGLAPKALILLAGITMNIIVAIICLGINLVSNDYFFTMPNLADYKFNNVEVQESAFPLRVGEVKEDSPAKGILEKDELLISINENRFDNYAEFSELLKSNQNKEIKIGFINIDDFTTYSKNVTLGSAEADGSILKVSLSYDNRLNRPIYFLKYNKNFSAPFSMTYDLSFYQIKALGSLLSDAFSDGDFAEVSKTVGGPIAAVDTIGEVVKYEILQVLIPLTGFISLSLAIVNVLPLPALDGGQLLIAAIESIRRKTFSEETLAKVNFIGFSFIILLSIVITLKDVAQFNVIQNFGKLIDGVLGR